MARRIPERTNRAERISSRGRDRAEARALRHERQSHVSSGPPAIPEGRISRFRFWPWLSPRGLSEMGEALALAPMHPNPFRFTSQLVLQSWLLRLASLTILAPPSAQSSFASPKSYSCQGGVQHHLEQGSCDFYTRAKIRTVTGTGIGHPSRPNQAIDGKRTSTFLDLQPCRPPSRDFHPQWTSAFSRRT